MPLSPPTTKLKTHHSEKEKERKKQHKANKKRRSGGDRLITMKAFHHHHHHHHHNIVTIPWQPILPPQENTHSTFIYKGKKGENTSFWNIILYFFVCGVYGGF